MFVDMLGKKFKDGCTPLHYAARRTRHLNVSQINIVKLVVRSYPGVLFAAVEYEIMNLDDMKLMVVEWSYQTLKR